MSSAAIAQESARDAAKRFLSSARKEGFKPVGLHAYNDADGNPLFWRIRAKHPEDGRKWIRPMLLDGQRYELREPNFPLGKKPLYGLDTIARNPQAAVWVVEGESCADALTKLGVVATTSGGADSASSADWSPLSGREVILWPDNDDAGKRHMGEVAAALLQLNCRMSAINVETLGLAPKGDAVDWLRTHQDASQSDLAALPRVTAAVDQAPSRIAPAGRLRQGNSRQKVGGSLRNYPSITNLDRSRLILDWKGINR